MQASSCETSTSRFDPVRRVATRAVAAQTSEQSRQVRTHWSMSIASARQASAHELQIAEQ